MIEITQIRCTKEVSSGKGSGFKNWFAFRTLFHRLPVKTTCPNSLFGSRLIHFYSSNTTNP